MDRRLDWIVRNGAFAAALYFAMVMHVDWLVYAIAAFVWWTLAMSVRALPEASQSRSITATAVSQPSTMAFDLAVLGSMFVGHWYWTAFAYALSCGCVAVAQARAISKP
jgi:hypothetical protein